MMPENTSHPIKRVIIQKEDLPPKTGAQKGGHGFLLVVRNLLRVVLVVALSFLLLLPGENPVVGFLTKTSSTIRSYYSQRKQLQPSPTAQNGLIYHLRFEETSPSDPHFVPGPKGEGMGYSFNGNGDYLELSEPVSIPNQSGAISWWMKRSEPGYMNIFSVATRSASGQIEIGGQPETVNSDLIDSIRVESHTNNKWQKYFKTGINTSDDKWHNYAIIFVNNQTQLYVDGRLMDKQAPNSDARSLRIKFIGHQQVRNLQSSYGDWLKGELAGVKIYDRPLTQSEIASAYYKIPTFLVSSDFKNLFLAVLAVLALSLTVIEFKLKRLPR